MGKLGIMFVHGLGSDSSCWDIFKTLLKNEPFYSKLIIHDFTYTTKLLPKFLYKFKLLSTITNYVFKSKFIRNQFIKINSIDYCAELLATDMFAKFYQIKHVLLVCHSMGGLVARKYLLHHIDKHKTKLFNVKTLLMYASPHTGAEIINLLNKTTPLNHVISSNPQLKDLIPNSEFLDKINTGWFDYVELTSLNVFNAVAENDDFVNADEIKEFWGEYIDGYMPVSQTNHYNIIRPKSNKDTSYLILRNEIDKCLKQIDRDDEIEEEKDDKTDET